MAERDRKERNRRDGARVAKIDRKERNRRDGARVAEIERSEGRGDRQKRKKIKEIEVGSRR